MKTQQIGLIKINLKKVLAIAESNKFNHKNKIGKFKCNKIKDLINNTKSNTISKELAKKNLDKLNELKNAEIKDKCLIPSQKELLDFFDNLLDIILTENNNNNNSNKSNNNQNESESENENESQNEKNYEIKQINNYFEMTDETKSFEEQINIFKKNCLNECWSMEYCDNKEINLKFILNLKLKFAYLLSDFDDDLFKEIFGHKFVALANTLIHATNKEENQIIINDIKKDKNKIYKQDDFNNFVIQPSYKPGDLIDATTSILEFNETIQFDDD